MNETRTKPTDATVAAHAQVSPARFVAKLSGLILLASLACAGIAACDGAARVVFQIALGVLFAHAVELGHQCIHKTATGRGRVDQALGVVLCLPALVSFWVYFFFHHWHHKHNGTAKDRESFSYFYAYLQSPWRLTRVLGFALHVSQVAHYLAAGRRMALALIGRLAPELDHGDPALPAATAARAQRDYRIMVALLAAAVLASLATGTWAVVTFWLLPLLIGYGPAHALIELPEHFGCDHPTDDVRANTRTVHAGRFARWLTNGNNFHVLHHEYPNVSVDALLALQAQRDAAGGQKFVSVSYPAYFRELLAYIWTGPRCRAE